MSRENVELVRRNYEVVNAIGRTGAKFVDPEEFAPDLWSRLAADFELRERPDLPDAKTYRGPDEAKDFWRKTQDLFSELRWEPLEIIDLGHAVVVETRLTARVSRRGRRRSKRWSAASRGFPKRVANPLSGEPDRFRTSLET